MTTKTLQVVVCDLCTSDRPAVAHIEIDVCHRHDQQIATNTGAVAMVSVCDLCDRSFRTKGGLQHHITVTHPEEREQKANVKCEVCGRMFINNSGLGAHRLRAHGIAGAAHKRAS